MTRADAAIMRLRIAGQSSLDERALTRCAERGEGCEYVPYDVAQALPADESAKLVPHHSHAGLWRVCPRHQPSRRHAWVLDVAIEDFMAHVAEQGGGAWPIDGLRKYLPKRHLEYRAL